ncbi:MAG: hypothetical protein KA144_14060 [Xanthomonadaceae bacterium]|nr:hypothetical protein [Xanthomonadaceae bacterium]
MATMLIVGLTGCGDSGVDRAGKAALAVDAYGCPDLNGTFSVSLTPERIGSDAGAMDEAFEKPDGNRVPIEQMHAVAIRRTQPGVFEFRWLIDESRVMQHLEVIREFEKPRYRRWYHLLSDPARAQHIEAYGQADYDKEMAKLGPDAELVRELRSGTTMHCEDGWLSLPRGELRPLRLSRGEDGSVIGEFKGLKTVGITVWCGDGCRDLPIPTGTFTGKVHWPRVDGVRAWRPQDMTGRFVFQRPIDEIEAEQAQIKDTQRRNDALRYLSAEEIRGRIEALAPAGTAIEQVEVLDGKVHIRYDAPKGEEDLLLGRIAAAGDGERGPKEVVHGARSTDMSRRFVRLVLTDSPLVLRERAVASTSVASAAASSIASASTAAQSTAAPPSMPPPILAALSEAPMQATPAGMASPDDLRKRLGALLPAGCRKIVDVRYGGERVTIVGQSNSTHCVSEALRALEGAGTRPELLQISADGSGGQRFRILLAASPLTRE